MPLNLKCFTLYFMLVRIFLFAVFTIIIYEKDENVCDFVLRSYFIMFINCPSCGFIMSEYLSADEKLMEILRQVFLCQICGGVWISGKSISEIMKMPSLPSDVEVKNAYTDAVETVKEGDRHCPECHELLEVIKIGEISVDKCTNCEGILFDKNELQQIWEQKYAVKPEKKLAMVVDPSPSKQEFPTEIKDASSDKKVKKDLSPSFKDGPLAKKIKEHFATKAAFSDEKIKENLPSASENKKIPVISSIFVSSEDYCKATKPSSKDTLVSDSENDKKTKIEKPNSKEKQWKDFEEWFNEHVKHEVQPVYSNNNPSIMDLFRM